MTITSSKIQLKLKLRSFNPYFFAIAAHIWGDEVERDGRNPSERQEWVGGVIHRHWLHSGNMRKVYSNKYPIKILELWKRKILIN